MKQSNSSSLKTHLQLVNNMTPKRIDVIVNKTWEFQPFFSALAHSNLVNRKLPRPTNVYHDLSEKGVTEPLAIIHLTENYDVMLH